MFAVIKTGGKQYRVAANDLIVVERLAHPEGEPLDSGDQVAFGEVLMLSDGEAVTIGAPVVAGAAVLGEVVARKRSAKVRLIKKTPRQTYRRRAGHRQHQTVVKILEIAPTGLKAAPLRAAKAQSAAVPAAPAPAKAARGKAAAAADDLTLIGGIGPKIALKLNELGVTSFQQIIDMDDAALQKIDDAIGFKGRALREDWRAQAAELKAGGAPRAKIDQEKAASEASAAKPARAKKAAAEAAETAAGEEAPAVKKPRATKKKADDAAQ